MIKRKTGFTLLELLITMVILALALAATSDMFVGLLKQYKRQSKISETNIEGVIGLELLRQDIERAGFGLPWVIPTTIPTYQEASATPASNYNDAAYSPPRPILSSDGTYTNGLLVIKATNIPRNARSQFWAYLTTSGTKSWTPSSENLKSSDYVTVLSPGTTDTDVRELLSGITQYSNITSPLPNSTGSTPTPQLIYGIWDSAVTPPFTFPFNRSDYYILGPGSSSNIPSRCAPNTGILVKAIISHKDGGRSDVLPLLDCVADMKVIFRLDRDGDGQIDANCSGSTDVLNDTSGTPLTAEQIRKQVKEVRVYILAQEGQMDTGYALPANTIIRVGDNNPQVDCGLGHNYDIGTNVNYRWKLYVIVSQPKNMRQSTQ